MWITLRSLLGKNKNDVWSVLTLLNERQDLLTEHERKYVDFLTLACQKTGKTPSENLFTNTFKETTQAIQNADITSLKEDLYIHIENIFSVRSRHQAGLEIAEVGNQVKVDGFSEEYFERIRDIYKSTKESDIPPPSLDNMFVKDTYEKGKNSPDGLTTCVNAIDEICTIDPGTVTTIMGYTGSFKTMWGTNIAYKNVVHRDANVYYMSLEVSKQDIWYNLLSRHSWEDCFNLRKFVGHDSIRRYKIQQVEEDFLWGTVFEDFRSRKGKILVEEDSDYQSITFEGIYTRLIEADNVFRNTTGKGIDLIVVDHLQLFKFSDSPVLQKLGEFSIMNHFVSFFRRICLDFNGKQTAVLLLAQTNREGWTNAVKNDGRYNTRALAEANEAERASFRIFSVYTDEQMKQAKEAKVQVLKNRSGRTHEEPLVVFADPEAYVFGDFVSNFNNLPSPNNFANNFFSDDEDSPFADISGGGTLPGMGDDDSNERSRLRKLAEEKREEERKQQELKISSVSTMEEIDGNAEIFGDT
jgi:replicative DNA helicase